MDAGVELPSTWRWCRLYADSACERSTSFMYCCFQNKRHTGLVLCQ